MLFDTTWFVIVSWFAIACIVGIIVGAYVDMARSKKKHKEMKMRIRILKEEEAMRKQLELV